GRERHCAVAHRLRDLPVRHRRRRAGRAACAAACTRQAHRAAVSACGCRLGGGTKGMMRIAQEAASGPFPRAIVSAPSASWDFRRAIWLAPLIAAWILAALMTQVSAVNAHPDAIYHA